MAADNCDDYIDYKNDCSGWSKIKAMYLNDGLNFKKFFVLKISFY